jgi:hypothetical protein
VASANRGAESDFERLFRVAPAFIQMLPVAIFWCDSRGRILGFNRRAAELWGRQPRIGDDTELFCGSSRLYFNGRQIRDQETPVAQVLRTGNPIRDNIRRRTI